MRVFSALDGLPLILETPDEDEGYIAESHTVLGWMEAGTAL